MRLFFPGESKIPSSKHARLICEYIIKLIIIINLKFLYRIRYSILSINRNTENSLIFTNWDNNFLDIGKRKLFHSYTISKGNF